MLYTWEKEKKRKKSKILKHSFAPKEQTGFAYEAKA